MKWSLKYLFEGILVLFVLFILLYISIPRFVKSQKVYQIQSVETLVKTLRDICAENPEKLKQFKKHFLTVESEYHGIIRDRNGRIKADNSNIVTTLAGLNIQKILEEFDEIDCPVEIVESYHFFLNISYKNKLPYDSNSEDKLIYYAFSATNNPNADPNDGSVIFFVGENGYYKINPNWVIPFDATNGLDSIGGFTYDSQHDLPLPKAVE